VVLQDKKVIYDLLFRTSAETLLEVGFTSTVSIRQEQAYLKVLSPYGKVAT